MNTIAVIIVCFLLFDFLLRILTDILNLKSLTSKVPYEFSGCYEDTQYKRSQSYLKMNTQFGWLVSAFDLILIFAVWFGKGFPLLDQWVRHFGFGPVGTGMIYMGALIFIKSLLSLPFRMIDTFGIEEKYGFNKTTWHIFFSDIGKMIILSILIGAPLMAGILSFFEYAGENAWWYCWIAVTVFTLLLQFVAPNWIMPLFNKYTPLDEGPLKSAIMDYADSIDFPLENIQVMDGSKRSGKSNAFFTGFGKHKKIVLFDTLIEQHTDQEVLAILAHEMGHFKLRHIQKMMIMGLLQMGIMLYILSWFITYKGLFDAFYMKTPSVYAGLIFFGLLYSPIDFVIGIVFQMISRKHEFDADTFSAKTTGSGKPLIDALKKLSVSNLSNLTPHPLNVFLNYSHPPVLERIKKLNHFQTG